MGQKILEKKEKMLVCNIFSSSHNVFKRSLSLTKMKGFADEIFNRNVVKMIIFVCDRVGNIAGKGESAG